jgi:hypothetical protein
MPRAGGPPPRTLLWASTDQRPHRPGDFFSASSWSSVKARAHDHPSPLQLYASVRPPSRRVSAGGATRAHTGIPHHSPRFLSASSWRPPSSAPASRWCAATEERVVLANPDMVGRVAQAPPAPGLQSRRPHRLPAAEELPWCPNPFP